MHLLAHRQILVALLPGDSAVTRVPRDTSTSTTELTAVVIDTLRFTTTSCRALQVGARSVRVAASVERARRMAAHLANPPLLCGERYCHPIEGFDLGNSPFDYTRETVQDRELVFTTSNGTLAIDAVQHLPHIMLAALVNRHAVCQRLHADTAGDVLIVCAGTDGQLTWEDVLTAGAIVDELLATDGFAIGHDTARLAQAAWLAATSGIKSATELPAKLFIELSRALGGRNLLSAGYERDLHFASQLDTIDIVPQNSKEQPRAFTGDGQCVSQSNV